MFKNADHMSSPKRSLSGDADVIFGVKQAGLTREE